MPTTFINPVQGVHSSPASVGPKFCAPGTMNVMEHDGKLVKRGGTKPIAHVVGKRAVPYMGWATAPAEPSSVANTGTLSSPAFTQALYIGSASKFGVAEIAGTCLAYYYADSDSTMTLEYWNGSAWAVVPSGFRGLDGWKTNTDDSGSTYNAHIIAPLVAYGYENTGTSIVCRYTFCFLAPSDWAAKTIATQSKYWVRLRGWATTNLSNRAATPATSWVQSTENRILHVNTFTGRDNSAHTFMAYLYGDTGHEIRFSLDGTVLAQDAGFKTNGDEDAGTGTAPYNKDTVVRSFYHETTGRLIGWCEGAGWFYVVPTQGTDLYPFRADSAGTDTPYASDLNGLRSVIPDGKVSMLADGRFWAAVGQRLYWSAPAFYPDIWPNGSILSSRFQRNLEDDAGDIVALASCPGVVVVFKRDATWVGTSAGDDSYVFQRIQGGLGCIAQDSVAANGNDVFRLTESGPAVLKSGNSEELIQDSISGILERPWCSNPERAVGVFHSLWRQYRLFYVSPGSASTRDAAWYGNIPAGKSRSGVSWWPQGRIADDTTSWGFEATAVRMDATGSRNRMLVGDRFGILWEHDVPYECLDGPSPIKRVIITGPIGSLSAGQNIIRWACVSFDHTGKKAWTLSLVTEMRSELAKTVTLNAVKSGSKAVGVLDATDTWGATGVFVDVSDVVMRQVQFGRRARIAHFEVRDTTSAPMVLCGIEVEVNRAGRRTET